MTTRTILCVDDEQAVLDGLRRTLRGSFELCFARSGEEALETLRATPGISVVLSDLRMPGMGGIALLETIAGRYPDISRVMLTGNADQQSAIDAVNRGHVFTFLNKPCAPEALSAALRAAVTQHELRIAEREILEQTLTGSVRMLIEILSSGQPALYGRAMRVRAVALELAALTAGGFNGWQLGMAAMLQPIGWATLPPSLAERHLAGGALDEKHQAAIEGVGAASARLLRLIPRLGAVADLILQGTSKAADGAAASREALILRLANRLVDEAAGNKIDGPTIDRLLQDGGPEAAPLLRAYRDTVVSPSDSVPAMAYDELELVRPAQMKPGDLLREDLRFADGSLALAAGTAVTAFQIERLEIHHQLDRVKGGIPVRRMHPPSPAMRGAA